MDLGDFFSWKGIGILHRVIIDATMPRPIRLELSPHWVDRSQAARLGPHLGTEQLWFTPRIVPLPFHAAIQHARVLGTLGANHTSSLRDGIMIRQHELCQRETSEPLGTLIRMRIGSGAGLHSSLSVLGAEISFTRAAATQVKNVSSSLHKPEIHSPCPTQASCLTCLLHAFQDRGYWI